MTVVFNSVTLKEQKGGGVGSNLRKTNKIVSVVLEELLLGCSGIFFDYL